MDLARREGIGSAHESYVFGIGKVVKNCVFHWRSIPAILRPRPHITVFYSGIVLALLGGAVLLATV